MAHRIQLSFLVVAIMVLPIAEVRGAVAVVMTDSELDAVHAGGLNFDFDAVLGSANFRSDNMGNSVPNINPVHLTPVVVSPVNPAIQVGPVPAVPAVPALPALPAMPALAAMAAVPAEPAVASNTPNTVISAPSQAGILSSLPTARDLNAAVLPDSPQTTTAAAASPVADTPRTVDITAALGSGLQVSVSPNSGASAVPFNTNGGFNSVNVADTAQQQLRAMVNVNAAGSIVPVQINLTVIMNSTVSSINSNNSMSVSNFTTSRMQ